jgi:hypothetical protein
MPGAPAPAAPSFEKGSDAAPDENPTTVLSGEAPEYRTTPPAWDPLGVATFAWDLPEPPAAAPLAPVKAPRSRLTPAFIGLAIVAAAVAAAVEPRVGWLNVVGVGAIALGIIGIGLVIGAFRHTGYGLLTAAAPLAVFVLAGNLFTTDFELPPQVAREFGYELGYDNPAAADSDADDDSEDDAPALPKPAGTVVDLRESQPVDATFSYTSASDVTVLVPRDANLVTSCTPAGRSDCLPSTTGNDGPTLTISIAITGESGHARIAYDD